MQLVNKSSPNAAGKKIRSSPNAAGKNNPGKRAISIFGKTST